MKRKIVLTLLSLLLVITVPMAAAAKNKEDGGPVGRPSVSQVPVETPKPNVTPLPRATPTPTPVPTAAPSQTTSPNIGNGTTAPTTAPQVSSSPSAVPNPINTPAPDTTAQTTTTPAATPSPAPTEGTLTLVAEADNGVKEGFTISVTGTSQDGNEYSRDYRTDETGQVVLSIPPGSYTAVPKEGSHVNQGYEIPDGQQFSITAGESIYLTFYFTATQRNLTLTVVDDDDTPLENVTIGIYAVEDLEEKPVEEEVPIKDTTDVTQKIEESSQAAAEEERRQNPYDRSNALALGKTDVEGKVTIEEVPVTDLVAVAIDVPTGYSLEMVPTDIPSGLDTEFEVLCEYLKVDLEIANESTGIPVVDAEAVLYDANGEELANWLTEGRPHRLIRVPVGEYSLDIHYEDQTDTIALNVTNDTTLQDMELTTFIQGSAVPEETDDGPNLNWAGILIGVVVVAVLCVAGVFGFRWFREYRKRSGGYQ